MKIADDAVELYREEGLPGLLSGIRRFSYWRSRRIFNVIQSIPFQYTHPNPVDVVSEDWDILILLDACRYDYFEEVCEFTGILESRISPAGSSNTFIKRSFAGRDLHDTVYVTANPYVTEVPDGTFHAVHDAPLQDGFDPDLGTVPPEEVTGAALDAANKYPNKRLIIHYMQPHMPPLGPTAELLDSEFGLKGMRMGREGPVDGTNIYDIARKGLIERNTVRQCYRETLNIVLNEIEDLLPSICGKTVLSADHGEFLGERCVLDRQDRFGHGNINKQPRHEKLLKVPWFILPSNERREIQSDPPTTAQPKAEPSMEQLRALGYT